MLDFSCWHLITYEGENKKGKRKNELSDMPYLSCDIFDV